MSRTPASEEPAFASTALVALVVHALRERAPELLPANLERVDAIRQAHTPMALKRELLDRAWRALGGRFVFEIGRGLERFGANPILGALLRSDDAAVLLEKWRRYERYGHARHRTRVEREAEGDVVLRHYATSGPKPGATHDVFVLGVLVALLEAIGTPALRVALLPGDRVLVEGGQRRGVADEVFDAPTDRWQLAWKAPVPARTKEATVAPKGDALADRVRALLAADPARGWSLARVGGALGTSARTLQRRLAAEDTSFSELVRSVRVNEACRLLETTGHSLTEIGYLCGFSDAAHFSRDFRASVGASPSDFRTVVDRSRA